MPNRKTSPHKTCKNCGIDFTETTHKTMYCHSCHYDRYQRNNPKAKKDAHWRHLKACFGITKEEYTMLFENQQGKCAICECKPDEQINIKGEPMKKKNLSVDHKHTEADWARGTRDKTTIRGLLCVNCNQALGGFKDNVENLQRAINYLQRSSPLLHNSVE